MALIPRNMGLNLGEALSYLTFPYLVRQKKARNWKTRPEKSGEPIGVVLEMAQLGR